MKACCVIPSALLLADCVSSPPGPALTVEQATNLAVQLANGKASTLYQVQPFHEGRPARFAAGHWVWTDRRGVGQMDMQVTVELAADGATNRVDLNVFDSMIRL